ncbi:MAG: hypothetical protein ONB46_09010 [candidate division KSB1 bacterium]|nr:hypothetical protein [candidate division KSB1 bacterium]MDZ7365836.1 hypothetical protein [candidate division KSB1 bacterium]MDZ7403929.1 hypothetical protein [candidate division KSB1 bacterium]
MTGEIRRRRLFAFGLIFAALFFFWNTALAQDKAFQTEVLQKLKEIANRFNALEIRLNDMDKRYEVRFATLETKLEAVNQRIDDKFNLIVGLLGLLAALLALPYAPKLLERFKAPPDSKKDVQRLQEQIEQIKTQLAQLSPPMRPTP